MWILRQETRKAFLGAYIGGGGGYNWTEKKNYMAVQIKICFEVTRLFKLQKVVNLFSYKVEGGKYGGRVLQVDGLITAGGLISKVVAGDL